jgi:demethylmenaquinone methyltransferase/2-methoxy-6-polyprenyl-1,4-benzoquinol methylase
MTHEPDILGYYAARAREYESVYAKPERQNDLGVLHLVVPGFFRGRHVLEVACGTGYWTRRIAASAAHVTACDLVDEVLAVAAASQTPSEHVEYRKADAFHLNDVAGHFDAAFAGFWWSHVRRQDLPPFLNGLHRRLSPGATVVVVDNRYVAGSNWPITRTDDAGDTYQRRTVNDGTEHQVLKNFPSSLEVVAAIAAAGGNDVEYNELTYYWYVSYVVS